MAEGKVVASYLVRVTVRNEMADNDPPVLPTNERLEGAIRDAIATSFDIDEREISVSSERLDK